jgi:hypothetical protein
VTFQDAGQEGRTRLSRPGRKRGRRPAREKLGRGHQDAVGGAEGIVSPDEQRLRSSICRPGDSGRQQRQRRSGTGAFRMPPDVPAVSIKIVAGLTGYLTEQGQRSVEAGHIRYLAARRQLRLRDPGARGPILLAAKGASWLQHQAVAAALPVPVGEHLAEFVRAARGWRAQPRLGMQAQPGQRPVSRHPPAVSGHLAQPQP